MKRHYAVIAVGTIAFAGLGMAISISQSQPTEKGRQSAVQDTPALVRFHSPIYGAPGAKVEVVEFFDPACETCRQFYPLVKDLVDSSGGKVRVVLRYAAFHRGSDEVVKMLEAARKQQRFWPALDAVLNAQPQWAAHDKPQPQLIWNYLGGVGVDVEKAKKDVNDPRTAAILEQDRADIVALKITGTPTFFVNGKRLQELGFEQLTTMVRREVDAAYPR